MNHSFEQALKDAYHEQMIKDVYYMAGMLEGLSCMQGQPLTEAAVFILADCVDRLELMGTRLLAKDVKHSEEATEATWPEQASQ